MTKSEAQAFRARWRLVAEAEREELRATPPESKLRQLLALHASARLFMPLADDNREQQIIWLRWARLRRALGA